MVRSDPKSQARAELRERVKRALAALGHDVEVVHSHNHTTPDGEDVFHLMAGKRRLKLEPNCTEEEIAETLAASGFTAKS